MKQVSISLLLLLICFNIDLTAQDYHLALRTGYIQSDIVYNGEDPGFVKPRQAFQIGLVHTFKPLSGNVGLSIETGYSLRGQRIQVDTLDYRLHYLNLPVLLDVYPTEKLRLSAGPEISYLLDGRNQVNDSTSFSLDNVITNRWEVAGTISASYEIDFFMQVGARYSLGLTDLGDVDSILDRRRPRNRSFQVFLYFKIAN